ncbi:Vegetative incompatibility protein HET-E-1 [Rhizoctonia solani]|uniref:Vegetative incompatibility protein HET-E-1 n=1 Tax=Rhizoctonia solani TaxID=456999 RepID=A0A8H8SXU2_9AGAM|nr:Vegetative incompatibility protein HET-E-1 [Rhizoctonia solani]QRW22496.1 Vegetative incompatibility protein HET-E-1 [Rhizoctonia solani]
MRVWRISDGSLAAGPFIGHTESIWSVTYLPDGTRVISGSNDKTVRVWNVRGGEALPVFSEDTLLKITSLGFSSGGIHVLAGSDNSGMQVWGVSDGTPQPVSSNMQLSSRMTCATSPGGLYTAQTNKYKKLSQIVRTEDGSVAAGPFNRPLGFGNFLTTVPTSLDDWVDLIAQWLDLSLLASVNDNDFDSSRSLRIWNPYAPILDFQFPAHSTLSSAPGQTLPDVYNQCHINRDGWSVNGRNDLLFWLPSEIADAGLSPFVSVIITRSGTLQVPKQTLAVGQEWGKCYVQG